MADQVRHDDLAGAWGRLPPFFIYKKNESRNFFDSHLYYFGSGSFTHCGVQDDTQKKERRNLVLRQSFVFRLTLQADQPFRILGHGVVECIAGVDFLLEVVGKLLRHFRIVTGELLVAVFGVDVFCDRNRRLLGVENKGSLAFGGESRVVAEQSPVTGIHSHLLVLKLAVEIETVVDAGAVADDQRRTIVCFRFLENLQGLSVVCAEGNATDVNVLIAHGDEAEVLLAGALTGGSEEGDCATVRGLGCLSTGVGVHFGIEDADVHVFARGHHVVETTVTDVVCPTVTV